MKKIIPVILIIALALMMSACGDDTADFEDINIEDVAKVQTDDSGAHFAKFEVTEAQASDLDTLNTWYVEYFKPMRDDGSLDYMVITYSDRDEYCTFFTGVNVYTGCKYKDGIGVIKTAEKHYMTGSHDGMLSEAE